MTTTTPSGVNFDSTILAAATYDNRHGHLQLDFRDGSRYVYRGVAPDLFRELLCAPSKGSFFNRYIRGRFPYAKTRCEN